MPNDHQRTIVRRRPDGVAQILALPLPSLSLGTFRKLWLGVLGAALLVAALVMAPIWLAFGGRTAAQGRAGQGPTVSGLGDHRR